MFLKLIEVISTITKLSSLTLHFEIDPDVCSSSIIYIAVGGFSLQYYGEKSTKFWENYRISIPLTQSKRPNRT